LDFEGHIVNNEEEPLHVAGDAAGEDEEDHELAVDEQHVDDGQQLEPSVEVALPITVVLLQTLVEVGLSSSRILGQGTVHHLHYSL
jgi:hypothetical protein